ncbi:MAG: hypothetical protein V1702_05770 [Candidatus Woesearchaeota archaeon]
MPEDPEPLKGPIDVRKMRAGIKNLPPGKSPFDWRDWPSRIKFNGMFDLESLYRFMAHWLKQRRYELHETMYKFKPPEFNLKFRAEKKKSGFVKTIINVDLHMWGEYDIETIVNGKKKKMANGRMILTIDIELEAPYANMFGEKRWSLPMERKLLRFFQEYVMKRDFEELDFDVLWYELYQFHTAIKEHMKLEARGSAY